MLEVILSTTYQGKIDCLPVLLSRDGDIISLRFEEHKQFAGIIVSKDLQRLLKEFAVHLTATLTVKQSQTVKGKNKDTSGPKLRRDNALARILIYGQAEDRNGVGDLMSESGLFFQHPTAEEADTSVPYFNPHLLLRPGAEMPRIEGLSISASESVVEASGKLDEVGKGLIWKIFDQANGFSGVTKVTESRRLKSKLHR